MRRGHTPDKNRVRTNPTGTGEIMDEKTLLLAIIRHMIMGQPEEIPEIQPAECEALLRLADRHDLGHIVSYWIERNRAPADEEQLQVYRRSRRMAVFRETKQEYVRELLFRTFGEAGIPFIPMKGLCLRALYPEGWMRTSGDLDVLVHEEDLTRAVQVLVGQGFTTDGKREYHDVVLCHSGVKVELHFTICENIEQMDQVLRRVWDYTEYVDGTQYRETDAFFLFHHIAHMCYHFKEGGCGVRALIDLCLMRRAGMCGGDELTELLRQSGLLIFYETVCRLSAVWFDGAVHDDDTEAMEQYVLSGGIYGSIENRSAVAAGQKRGRLSFLLRRIFPGVPYMKARYPVLNRSRAAILLLPFLYVYRGFETVCGKKRSHIGDAISEYKYIRYVEQDKIDATARLMKAVGLEWL